MRYRWPWLRLFHATRYSVDGIWAALKQEQAFRYEAVVLVILCAVSCFLSWGQALALTGAWLVVMVFELVNGAVERAFDLIDTRFRPKIKEGKDMLSAAVFLMIDFNIILWAVVMIRYCLRDG